LIERLIRLKSLAHFHLL